MRLSVNKTYKMLIGGAFVRSESNRTLETPDRINAPRATRKDVRDAVKAARAAFPGWATKTAYNRGQILYRLAEMLEARRKEFAELEAAQLAKTVEVDAAVDRLLYYAGWSDKYQQILGSVNPVAAPYFNFSVPEPMGVIGLAPSGGLLGIVSVMAPVIVGGNTSVLLAPDDAALLACEFGEIVATSDVPSGVVNILTGTQSETLPHLARHMDVNALACPTSMVPLGGPLVDDATANLKRLVLLDSLDNDGQGLDWIGRFQETKTVWHPIGV